MKLNRLSVKILCLLIGAGTLFLMLLLTGLFFALTGNKMILLCGAGLTACALIGLAFLVLLFGKRLSLFTNDLCRILDA
ncbi:hypothetical protein C805_01528 [Eubacterium sp. 14-2]|nr:hypothetical protein C805_01528 [Eubacterium sp. 14-2]